MFPNPGLSSKFCFPIHPACFCKDWEGGDDVLTDLRDEPQGDIPAITERCNSVVWIPFLDQLNFQGAKGPSSQSEFGSCQSCQSCLVTPADIRPGGTKLISKKSFLGSTWQDVLGRTVDESPDGLLSMLTSFYFFGSTLSILEVEHKM